MTYTFIIRENLKGEIKEYKINSSSPKDALKTFYAVYVQKYARKYSSEKIIGKIINNSIKTIARYQVFYDKDKGVRYVLGTFKDMKTSEEVPKSKPVIVMEEASDFIPKKVHDKVWFGDMFIPRKLFDELDIEKDDDFPDLNLFKIMKDGYRAYQFAFDTENKLLLMNYRMMNKEFYEKYVSNKKKFDISNFIRIDLLLVFDEGRNTIHFPQYHIDDMKNKISSQKIVETIKMFMKNGLRENDKVSFRGYKEYKAKYFLKTKVLW